jgi:hypothetical protein
LAIRFQEAIFPEGGIDLVGGNKPKRISMAALQGYLLGYKEDPVAAVENAVIWAEEMDGGVVPVRSQGMPPPPTTPIVTITVPSTKKKAARVSGSIGLKEN